MGFLRTVPKTQGNIFSAAQSIWEIAHNSRKETTELTNCSSIGIKVTIQWTKQRIGTHAWDLQTESGIQATLHYFEMHKHQKRKNLEDWKITIERTKAIPFHLQGNFRGRHRNHKRMNTKFHKLPNQMSIKTKTKWHHRLDPKFTNNQNTVWKYNEEHIKIMYTD